MEKPRVEQKMSSDELKGASAAGPSHKFKASIVSIAILLAVAVAVCVVIIAIKQGSDNNSDKANSDTPTLSDEEQAQVDAQNKEFEVVDSVGFQPEQTEEERQASAVALGKLIKGSDLSDLQRDRALEALISDCYLNLDEPCLLNLKKDYSDYDIDIGRIDTLVENVKAFDKAQ